MRVREEQILEPVIVKIVHAHAPAGKLAGGASQSRGTGTVFEKCRTSGVPEQQIRVVDHTRHHDVRQTIVVVIAEIHTHARDGAAAVAEGDAGFQAYLAKLVAPEVL